jgi:hypothetical protein
MLRSIVIMIIFHTIKIKLNFNDFVASFPLNFYTAAIKKDSFNFQLSALAII